LNGKQYFGNKEFFFKFTQSCVLLSRLGGGGGGEKEEVEEKEYEEVD
jgi:hypothetical protein